MASKTKNKQTKEKLQEPKQKKVPPEGYIVVNEIEDWLQAHISNGFEDNDLFRIVLFYVIFSPCRKGSYSRKSIETYGWKNPWHYLDFKEKVDEIASLIPEKSYFYNTAQKNFKTLWESTGFQNDFYNIQNNEFAVFTHVGESNSHLDLLHHIRNSLAHGRFTAKKYNHEYYMYMEDVNETGGFYLVNARIVLKKSTLIKLIDFFQCNTEEAKKLCQDLSQRNTKPGNKNANPVSKNSNPTKKN